MRYIIGIRKALICIYRSSLIFCVVLAIGCGCENCFGKTRKDSPALVQQIPLGEQAAKQKLHVTDDFKPSIEKVTRLKRVAKVPEGKQAIVCLHGLHRLSYDFDVMKAALQEKFPHATIVALTSVDKDPNKKGFVFLPASSLTVELSIKEQTRLAYEEIKTKIGRGKHVVIVGHSQGGLRGFTLVKEYGDRLRNADGIVINQLITIATPWKGAPVMGYINNVERFKQKFDKIAPTLDSMQKHYSKNVRGYFFKFMPGLTRAWPRLYEKVVPYIMGKIYLGAADLRPESDFIRHYVASGLKEVDLPITAIAGVLTDFSKLFEPFAFPISDQALAQLNARYAELIGGDPNCEHDMLLPVSTQHAEGLVTKNFKRIKVYDACHGNKVGIKVKDGLSEFNNKAVIAKVIESIEEAFYKEEEVIEKEEVVASAA